MRPTHVVALAGMICAFAAVPARAALTHRYSFNDGTANDAVGGANGVPINNPEIANGRINFLNTKVFPKPTEWQYLDLPNQIGRTPALTLETWATSRRSDNWQEIVTLGTGTAGEIAPGSTAQSPG